MSKHIADGSGLQEHSVGELYPFIILKRGDKWGWSNAVRGWAHIAYDTAQEATANARSVKKRQHYILVQQALMGPWQKEREAAYNELWRCALGAPPTYQWQQLHQVIKGWVQGEPITPKRITAASVLELKAPVAQEPSGYAYRYQDGIRFNDGRDVNGCKPAETVPYWLGATIDAAAPTPPTVLPDGWPKWFSVDKNGYCNVVDSISEAIDLARLHTDAFPELAPYSVMQLVPVTTLTADGHPVFQDAMKDFRKRCDDAGYLEGL